MLKFEKKILSSTVNLVLKSLYSSETRLVSLLQTGNNEIKINKKESCEIAILQKPQQVVPCCEKEKLANSKILVVEGQDKDFYDIIKLNLIKNAQIDTQIKIDIQSLEPGYQSKSNVIKRIENLNADELVKVFGIVDDDGDKFQHKSLYLKNLFHLKRYSKENYVFDPVNIYFYLLNNLDMLPRESDLVQSVQDEIKFSLGKQYLKFNLNQINEAIYMNKQYKDEMIKLLQIIIDKFELKLKETLLCNGDKLLNFLKQQKKLNISKLVCSELELFDTKNQSTRILLNLSDSDKPKTKKKLKLLEEYFTINKRFLNKNFDLAKCISAKHISENRKEFVLSNLNMSFDKYTQIRKSVKMLLNDCSTKYEVYLAETKDPIDLINQLFFSKKTVLVNRNILRYSNLFLNINGHTLERIIYPLILNNTRIWCNEVTKSFSTNGILIPDEVTCVFKYLSTNVIELNEDNFEHFVFNSNDHYFIKFSVFDFNKPVLNYDANLVKAAIKLNGRACFGVYFVKSPEDRIFIKLKRVKLVKKVQDLPKLFYFDPSIDLEDELNVLNDSVAYSYTMNLIEYCKSKLDKLDDFIELDAEKTSKNKSKTKKKKDK